MYSNDYAKTVAIKPNEKQIPLVLGGLALAAILVAAWFGFNLVTTYMPIDQPVAQSHP